MHYSVKVMLQNELLRYFIQLKFKRNLDLTFALSLFLCVEDEEF